ncbi:unnamed protein product [Sphagnum balticum]
MGCGSPEDVLLDAKYGLSSSEYSPESNVPLGILYVCQSVFMLAVYIPCFIVILSAELQVRNFINLTILIRLIVRTEKRVLPAVGSDRSSRHASNSIRLHGGGYTQHHWRTVLFASMVVQDIERLFCPYGRIVLNYPTQSYGLQSHGSLIRPRVACLRCAE